MIKAAFCGSFDPLTIGHMDLIERASRIFEEVWVFVTPNSSKKEAWSAQMRMDWIVQAAGNAALDNVRVAIAEGLAVENAARKGCSILLRGIRNETDMAYEANMACMNSLLNGKIETMALFCNPAYTYISSSNVRELIRYRQSIEAFVPDNVFASIQPDLYEQALLRRQAEQGKEAA